MEKLQADKFRTILEANEGEIEKLKDLSKNNPWKPVFHIHPECGLLNDPNGLAYFNGEYHVFYQWYPFGAIHGMKHWSHVKSKDLAYWERMPVAIIPTEDYESHGAYTGSAIEKNGELLFIYTGNVRYADESRSSNQCLARMNKDYTITKAANNPLIEGIPPGYTGHVRDPKIWRSEEGKYHLFLGAQRENLTAALIVYESDDAIQWNFKGELKTGLDNFGYMWECPDYFKLNGKDIFIFCPQGLEKEKYKYQNLYSVVYAVGKLDMDTLTFDIECIREVDKGFDFYAPQTFEDQVGRRVMIGWSGMSEIDYPSDRNQWAHCLTVPRELILEDNILKQKPVKEMEALRTDYVNIQGVLQNNSLAIENGLNHFELDVHFTNIQSRDIKVNLFKSEKEAFILCFDMENQVVVIDRQNFVNNFADEVGYSRRAMINLSQTIDLKIIVDQSIIEIFINDGELALTSRVFPLGEPTEIEISACGNVNFNIDKYILKRGIL